MGVDEFAEEALGIERPDIELVDIWPPAALIKKLAERTGVAVGPIQAMTMAAYVPYLVDSSAPRGADLPRVLLSVWRNREPGIAGATGAGCLVVSLDFRRSRRGQDDRVCRLPAKRSAAVRPATLAGELDGELPEAWRPACELPVPPTNSNTQFPRQPPQKPLSL